MTNELNSSYYDARYGLGYRSFYQHFLKMSENNNDSPIILQDSIRNKRLYTELRPVRLLDDNQHKHQEAMPKLEVVSSNAANENRAEAELKRQGKIKYTNTKKQRQSKTAPAKKKRSPKSQATKTGDIDKIKDVFSK